MTDNDELVLVWLSENTPDGYAMPFDPIARGTSIPRNDVRLSCRRLARKGLLIFCKGLWNEDGEPAGAGYALTHSGREMAEKIPWPTLRD